MSSSTKTAEAIESTVDWIAQASNSVSEDTRVRPWMTTLGKFVKNDFKEGPDLMTVSSQGGENVGSKMSRDTTLAA